MTVAGLTGTGKTCTANFWSGDPDKTYFINTEPTNTTLETLEVLGQEKVWSAYSWDDILAITDEFLKIAGKDQHTLVLDTGSVLVQWVKDKKSKMKGDKAVTPWEHEEVWEDIRGFLKKVITDHGHNLVMTLLLRPNYTPEGVNADGSKKYGVRDGTYSPYEWKDLVFCCHYAFQLEKGIYVPNIQKTYFPDKIFCRVRKTRYVNEGFKKFLVPMPYNDGKTTMHLYTEEAADAQLKSRYNGTFIDILKELSPSSVPSFQSELNEFFENSSKWKK